MQSEIRQQDSKVVGGIWDWLKQRREARHEADMEKARLATQQAQDKGLDLAVAEARQDPPTPIERANDELRPGERLIPHSVEKQRNMHDHPPVPQKPEQEQEATRMEYTRTPQPIPSLGGTGTFWKNPKAHKAPVMDGLIGERRSEIGQQNIEQLKTAEPSDRAAKAICTTDSDRHQPEDRLAAWRKNMTPEQQAAFDARRKQGQQSVTEQDQTLNEVPGQKPDI